MVSTRGRRPADGGEIETLAATHDEIPTANPAPMDVEEQELDSFRRQTQLRNELAALLNKLEDPTVLLQPSAELSASARQAAMVRMGHSMQSLPILRIDLAPHADNKAMYKYSVQQLLAGCSKGEARALREGQDPLLAELYAGEGFDAEQVSLHGTRSPLRLPPPPRFHWELIFGHWLNRMQPVCVLT